MSDFRVEKCGGLTVYHPVKPRPTQPAAGSKQ